MAEALVDLNVLNLSTQSLLIVLIVLLVLQCYGYLKCKQEGLLSNVDYDKYQAAYNQERDDSIGATSAGRPLNSKMVDAWGEGLVGGYNAPAFWDGHRYNMNQAKGPGNVVTTTRPIESETEGLRDPACDTISDPLERAMHGLSPEACLNQPEPAPEGFRR